MTSIILFDMVKKMYLFDEIPYKFVKNLNDEDEIEVKIEDVVCKCTEEECKCRPQGYSTSNFKFTLYYHDTDDFYSADRGYEGRPKTFTITKTYSNCSGFAIMLTDVLEYQEEEEEEEEEV